MRTTRIAEERRGISAPLTSVVVPAYNEGQAIVRNIARLYDHLDATMAPQSWELIVVDDGSTDDTAARVQRYARGYDNISIVLHERNRGLGAALKSGIDKARGACIVTLDSDLSYEPGIVNRLSEELRRSGSAMVLASPYMAGGYTSNVPITRLFMSVWANRLLSAASGGAIKTFTGMVRAYDSALLSALAWPESGNVNVGILLAARRAGAKVKVIEIPAELAWPLDRGASRLSFRRALQDVVSVLRYSAAFFLTRMK
jgi:dolichol-phosphate mannosyltransferase